MAKYYVDGRPVRVSTKTTKNTEAERFLAIHAGKSAGGDHIQFIGC